VEEGEKFATPLLAHDTVPVGEYPPTTAVQVVGEPSGTGEGEQVTEVVDFDGVTERGKVPEAGALLESP
jgi:hypothetical protein